MLSVYESLSSFMRGTLPSFLVATFLISLFPPQKDYVLRNGSEVLFALHALLITMGLVFLSCGCSASSCDPSAKLDEVSSQERNPASSCTRPSH